MLFQLTTSYNESDWFMMLTIGSALTSFLFFVYVWNTPKLQVHPITLISYLAFVESIYLFGIAVHYHACGLRLPELFSYTAFFSSSEYNKIYALNVILVTDMFFTSIAENVSVIMNTALCIDLVLIVRYPFEKKEKRIPYYVVITLVVSIAMAAGQWLMSYVRVGPYYMWEVAAVCTVISQCVYLVTFLYSVVYTCRKLSQPGISEEVRYLILKRHILQEVAFLVCMIYVFSCEWIILFQQWDKDSDDIVSPYESWDNWFSRLLKVLFRMQGYFIPLTRLSEPFFFLTIKQSY